MLTEFNYLLSRNYAQIVWVNCSQVSYLIWAIIRIYLYLLPTCLAILEYCYYKLKNRVIPKVYGANLLFKSQEIRFEPIAIKGPG